eukprot:837866-Pelagomonas_calceolata.AAC.1
MAASSALPMKKYQHPRNSHGICYLDSASCGKYRDLEKRSSAQKGGIHLTERADLGIEISEQHMFFILYVIKITDITDWRSTRGYKGLQGKKGLSQDV